MLRLICCTNASHRIGVRLFCSSFGPPARRPLRRALRSSASILIGTLSLALRFPDIIGPSPFRHGNLRPVSITTTDSAQCRLIVETVTTEKGRQKKVDRRDVHPNPLRVSGANPGRKVPQCQDTYATKSSDPPILLHRVPPPKESMKVPRESLLIDEDTGSGLVRHSPWVTCLHLVVVP
jgi:hypothetical protein